MIEANTDGGNVFHQIARELADQADAEAAARHPNIARTCAELGLLYMAFATHSPTGEHGDKAWRAAEDARSLLAEGAALGAAAEIALARLHLSLDLLDGRLSAVTPKL
ncbi:MULTISPECIES: hypothetical protein [Streptacidiphilus]|uniref:Uncharacterized protein n=1 Tax=Streptacidiphilus cavernicola TaxID=3342716 RepID=A0ABV6UWA8_9ACTN|nr:hypothetical protein [Streptacidiphilus jeojiense]